jgi:hypothetical protein
MRMNKLDDGSPGPPDEELPFGNPTCLSLAVSPGKDEMPLLIELPVILRAARLPSAAGSAPGCAASTPTSISR